MTEQTWVFADREKWPSGEWDDEPDKVEWTDRFTGLTCIARRGTSGSWCGYVGVRPGHPLHRVGYSSCSQGGCEDDWCDHRPESIIDVHGGLTYSDECNPRDDGTGVCHVPPPGEPDDLWWFGFDCAHSQDLSPGLEYTMRKVREDFYVKHGENLDPWISEYRNLEYVREQCQSMAKQLLALARSD